MSLEEVNVPLPVPPWGTVRVGVLPNVGVATMNKPIKKPAI